MTSRSLSRRALLRSGLSCAALASLSPLALAGALSEHPNLSAAEARALRVLRNWQAGGFTTEAAVRTFGIERCFGTAPIDERLFARMRGKSWKTNCTLDRDDLRHVRALHRTADGRIRAGELVCARELAPELLEILRELYDAAYPIELMTLVDEYDADDERSMRANNTSCFNYRVVKNTTQLSAHSLGRAIDVNPLYNPFVKRRKDGSTDVQPEAGRPWSDRTKRSEYTLLKGDACWKAFTSRGWEWGGAWSTCKDWQHFAKRRPQK